MELCFVVKQASWSSVQSLWHFQELKKGPLLLYLDILSPAFLPPFVAVLPVRGALGYYHF